MRLSPLKASTALTGTLAMMLSASLAHAMPTGGQAAAGQLSITSTSSQTTINQTSSRAVINWASFNVGQGETVTFNQPNASSVTLNRVSASAGMSQIDGIVSANGNVWVTNPSGMVFGKNAQINVGGMLATTSQITDQSFMSGSNPSLPFSSAVLIFSQISSTRSGGRKTSHLPLLAVGAG